jgi:lysophospholipase L1-like esterase
MRRSVRLVSEVTLALASVAGTLLALEGGLRLWAWRESGRTFERAMARARPPAPHATVTLAGLIRPSADARIVYELWSAMDVLFDYAHDGRPIRVVTNAAGFRGRDYPLEKARAVRRIVGLGDSLMFGWGVEQGQDYLSLLEARLAGSGERWEAVNTAVPGYNAAMEVETLKAKALRYRPDLVVYGFCANDASLPNFIRPLRSPLSLREVFLWEFLRSRFKREIEPDDALVAAPRRGDNHAFEDDPSRAPDGYRDITGWRAYDRALGELEELGRRNGFRTIVVSFGPGSDDPRQERGLRSAAELGLRIVDVGKAQAGFMRARGIVEYAGSALTLSATDLHPSPLSHQLAADALLAAMVGEGLVGPQVLERARPGFELQSKRSGS